MTTLDILALQNLTQSNHLSSDCFFFILRNYFDTPDTNSLDINSRFSVHSVNWNDWNDVYQFLKVRSGQFYFPADAVYQAYEESNSLLDYCLEQNYTVLTWGDENFPLTCRKIENPSAVLFAIGNTEILNNNKMLAVIGSRKVSTIGAEFAFEAGKIFAKQGFTVVSGLALGSDTCGHLGTLDAGGSTIAVLPNELDYIVPSTNRKLASRIAQEGGCLICEYPPSIPLGKPTIKMPPNYRYIERDRLQSALSKGIFVVETEIGGGTMHTVRFAIEQKNRSIACLSENIYSNTDSVIPTGNRSLLKKGIAKPINSFDELINFATHSCRYENHDENLNVFISERNLFQQDRLK